MTRVLGPETVGNSRGNGNISDEGGGGDFHLDHDEDLKMVDSVLKKVGSIDARRIGWGKVGS